jgi:hypothetical protein
MLDLPLGKGLLMRSKIALLVTLAPGELSSLLTSEVELLFSNSGEEEKVIIMVKIVGLNCKLTTFMIKELV